MKEHIPGSDPASPLGPAFHGLPEHLRDELPGTQDL